MASVVNDPNGRRRISYRVGCKSHSLRLGEVERDLATDYSGKIQRLISCRNAPQLIAPDVLRWIKGLSEKHYDQLAAAGLLPRRAAAAATCLGKFLDDVIAGARVKDGTQKFYGHTLRCLLLYFGRDRDLRTISAKEADAFHAWLATHEFTRAAQVPGGDAPKARRLSPATVSRRMQLARDWFARAVRWKLVEDNPFAGIRVAGQTNPARIVYVALGDFEKVLAATSDAQFRLVLALSRYGGLRCPSEHLQLTWNDVVWGTDDEPGRVTVRSPKTGHHAGHEVRVIPLFAPLRPFLQDVFDAAEPGAVHVITSWRAPGKNLRTRLQKTITRAGVKPWPKLFHNLRASCETDLVAEYPLKTVAEWLGHNPAIMVQHYLSNPDLDSDFARAAGGGGEEATRNPTRKEAQNGEKRKNNPRAGEAGNAEKAAEKPLSQDRLLGDEGLESPSGARDPRGFLKSDAQSDARRPGLREIIDVWPDLPPAVQAGILAMVRAMKGAANAQGADERNPSYHRSPRALLGAARPR